MAYKIQVGTAILGGSQTFEEGVVASDGGHLSGSVVSASSDIIAHGAAGGNDGMSVNAGGTITGASASFDQTGEYLVLDSLNNQGRVQLKKDLSGGGNTELARFFASNNTGSFVLNSTGAAVAQVQCLRGVLSGSAIELGGGLTVGGSNNMTVNGTLTISSGETILNVGTFETTDDLVELAGNLSGDGAGLAFGLTGSANSGAKILLETSGDNRFEILNGATGTNYIALSASTFYGNGGSLLGLSSQNVAVPITSKVGGNTLEVGFNKISGNGTFNLPAASGLTNGDEIIVKRSDANDGAVIIDAAGSDNIDGEGTITLEVANAAVVLVVSGSSFKVF